MPGSAFSPGRPGWSAERHLFLEATQLKTVRTVIVALRTEPVGVEAQAVGIDTRNGRRTNIPAVADVIQLARTAFGFFTSAAVAEARGRAASLFLEAAQLKTAPTGRFAGHSGEKAVAEAQEADTGTGHRQRPTVTAATYFPVVVAAEARGRAARHSNRAVSTLNKSRAPGEILPFQLIVETEYFLFRRGARVPLAPVGCFTGHSGEKISAEKSPVGRPARAADVKGETKQKKPQQNTQRGLRRDGRCCASLGSSG